MPCNCQYEADECDGEYATHYPLQDGGMCAVEKCRAPKKECTEEREQDALHDER